MQSVFFDELRLLFLLGLSLVWMCERKDRVYFCLYAFVNSLFVYVLCIGFVPGSCCRRQDAAARPAVREENFDSESSRKDSSGHGMPTGAFRRQKPCQEELRSSLAGLPDVPEDNSAGVDSGIRPQTVPRIESEQSVLASLDVLMHQGKVCWSGGAIVYQA